jgi:hypothetical protein
MLGSTGLTVARIAFCASRLRRRSVARPLIMNITMPPRDPNNDDDDDDGVEEEQEERRDEPAVIREPDE